MNKEFEFDKSENRFSKSENSVPENKEDKTFTLPYTVKLVEPIYLSEKTTITELEFKNRLNLKMLAHMPAGDTAVQKIGHMMPIIVGMCGQSEAVVDRLGWLDAQECFEVIQHFLTRLKEKISTGGTT